MISTTFRNITGGAGLVTMGTADVSARGWTGYQLLMGRGIGLVDARATPLDNLLGGRLSLLLAEVGLQYHGAAIWKFRTGLIKACLSVLGVISIR
ncbi:hypothetical protein Daus18300_012246 [Diaporthe australafricana]|uniref:Uncharacterized protein n=1 Tax=Diaporthe australafricana TaxID=127596 RepID=A0ABR3W3F4_9PEZI